MNEENIKEAAVNNDPRFIAIKAFIKGTEWRINSVWHDAKEEPKYNEYFLYENVVHTYQIDGIYLSEDEPFVWNNYVKDRKLTRWAYIKDLIPNTK